MGMVSSNGSKKNYKISRKSRVKKKNLAQIRLRQFSIVVFLFVLGVCLLSLYKMVFLPRIVLEGESVVEVPYLGKYKEDGYLSSYQGKDITSKVKVKGKVNYKKIGEYTITYEVSYHGRKSSKTRVIKVASEASRKFKTGDILVTTSTNNELLPYMKKASAIVVGPVTNPENCHAEIVGRALDIPVVMCNAKVIDFIANDALITVDPVKGFIYSGRPE